MANISLNGTSYSGTAASPGTPFKPSKIQELSHKIGELLIAADGTPNWMYRATKKEWRIDWDAVPENTRAAVATVAALNTTFTFIDERANSSTVLTTADDFTQETAYFAAGAQYYKLALTLRQA